eukprot:145185-Chlamydomonas_euryale.AAC.1
MDCCDTELDAPQLSPTPASPPRSMGKKSSSPKASRAARCNAQHSFDASYAWTRQTGFEPHWGAEVLRSCARGVARGQ